MSRTIKPVLLAFVALFIVIGCDKQAYVDAIEGVESSDGYAIERAAVTNAWEEIVGPVSESCIDTIAAKRLYETDTIPLSCLMALADGHKSDGCTIVQYETDDRDNWDAIIVILNTAIGGKSYTAIHEYTHLLQYCLQHKSDLRHTDHLMWLTYGDDTVEAKARIIFSYPIYAE